MFYSSQFSYNFVNRKEHNEMEMKVIFKINNRHIFTVNRFLQYKIQDNGSGNKTKMNRIIKTIMKL